MQKTNAVEKIGIEINSQIHKALSEVTENAYREMQERLIGMFSHLGLNYEVRVSPGTSEFIVRVEYHIPQFSLNR